MKERKITIDQVGGVAHFELVLRPGVTVLTGENGAGKSTSFNAAARLYGMPAPVEVRDGAARGTIAGDGVTLVVSKVVRASGTTDLRLAEVGALAQLIDPQLKDPDAAARARIRALLSLSRLPVTEEAVSTLAGDAEVAQRSMVSIKDSGITDLLGAAERVRLVAHDRKRIAEQDSATAAGEAAALDSRALAAKSAAGELVTTSVESAERAAQEARERAAQAKLLAKQREELASQQAAVRASLGPRPDPAPIAEEVEQSIGRETKIRAGITDLTAQIDRLSSDLGKLRTQLATQELETRSARARQAEVSEARVAWTKRAAILDRPITGPTEDAVRTAEEEARAADTLASKAAKSAEFRSAHEAAAAAHQRASESASRAVVLESLATTVGDRLASLLSGTAAEGLTVSNGRLAVINAEGKILDFETRQSEGQRARIAFRVAARAFAGRVVPLDGKLWSTWDPDRQAEIAQIAAEEGMYLITEAPTRDKTLGTIHLPAETV